MNDVTHIVEDGLLGLNAGNGTGRHVKVGVSPIISNIPILIRNTMSVTQIRELLGHSPLADAAMDSAENGAAYTLCIPVKPSNIGEIGTVTSIKTGTGDITVTGSPYNNFNIKIKIVNRGGLNEAVFVYSINGGASYSDNITVPDNGRYSIIEAGLELTFTSSEYLVNDKWEFKTIAPKLSNIEILEALKEIERINTEVEFCHIVGETNAELWTAVSSYQEYLANIKNKPILFVLETYNINETENIAEYANRLIIDAKKVKNYNVQVVATHSEYLGMDAVKRNVNNAAIVCGWYAKARIEQSIGEVRSFKMALGKMNKLLPNGIEDYIEDLDVAKYLTFRQYNGLDSYYVTNAKVMCPEGSDYRYLEDVRVLNKIIRLTRKEALMVLQTGVDIKDIQGDLDAKAVFISAPIKDMVKAKEITSVEITVPEGQDVLKTEKLTLKVRYVPIGKIRSIDIFIGVTNPVAG